MSENPVRGSDGQTGPATGNQQHATPEGSAVSRDCRPKRSD
jgi:hypothetical protein